MTGAALHGDLLADTEGLRRLTETVGARAWIGAATLRRVGAIDEAVNMAVVPCFDYVGYNTDAQIVVDGGLSLLGVRY